MAEETPVVISNSFMGENAKVSEFLAERHSKRVYRVMAVVLIILLVLTNVLWALSFLIGLGPCIFTTGLVVAIIVGALASDE